MSLPSHEVVRGGTPAPAEAAALAAAVAVLLEDERAAAGGGGAPPAHASRWRRMAALEAVAPMPMPDAALGRP